MIFSFALISCKANFNDNIIMDDVETETTRELIEEEIFKNRFIGDLDNVKFKFLKDDLVDDENIDSPSILESDKVDGKCGWIYYITEVEKKILINDGI